MDFDRVLAAVVEAGYAGYLVVEFPRRSKATVIADLEAGAAIARRFATDEDATRD